MVVNYTEDDWSEFYSSDLTVGRASRDDHFIYCVLHEPMQNLRSNRDASFKESWQHTATIIW